jgi:hypothetical protein
LALGAEMKNHYYGHKFTKYSSDGVADTQIIHGEDNSLMSRGAEETTFMCFANFS